MYAPAQVTLPPGIVRSSTRYGVKGRYFDAQMVRFHEGKPQRWGGWEKLIASSLTQPARGVLAWLANDGTRFIAFGTADKLWLINDDTLYDITPVGLPAGVVTGISDTAWGELTWGEGPWGGDEDEALGILVQASTWSLAKWGEDLLAVRRGSTLYRWSKASGTGVVAQAVAGAPTICTGVFVTAERHAVVYGAHDGSSVKPMRLQWPNQETLTTWTPSSTNTAGDMDLADGNEIRASVPIDDGHILLTDTAAYTWKFIGGDFIFSQRRLAGLHGIIGPNAGIEYAGDAYWMSVSGIVRYNGRVMDVPCDVHDFVFNNINKGQAFKVFAGVNRKFGELIWLYPDSTSEECNRYVTYQPGTGIWSIGAIDRTCWLDSSILTDKPIATAADGTVYLHETGDMGDGQPISYLLESGDVDVKPEGTIAAASNHLMVRKIVPDYERLDPGTHTLTIVRRDYPQAPPKEKGPYAFDNTTKQFSPRARGMTMALRFEGDADFRMGDIIGYVGASGGR